MSLEKTKKKNYKQIQKNSILINDGYNKSSIKTMQSILYSQSRKYFDGDPS